MCLDQDCLIQLFSSCILALGFVKSLTISLHGLFAVKPRHVCLLIASNRMSVSLYVLFTRCLIASCSALTSWRMLRLMHRTWLCYFRYSLLFNIIAQKFSGPSRTFKFRTTCQVSLRFHILVFFGFSVLHYFYRLIAQCALLTNFPSPYVLQ